VRGKEDRSTLEANLQEILDELRQIKATGLTIGGTHFRIRFKVCGDWKWLACVFGIVSRPLCFCFFF
jgi:hypothetical protein